MFEIDDELDQTKLIEQMRAEVRKLGGIFATDLELPSDMEVAFLRHVLEYEQAQPVSLLQILHDSDLKVPAPDDLDDSELTARLWEIIERMSSLGAYLLNTNHLSDRELYEYLYNDGLREQATLFPEDPTYAYTLDIVGGGSEEEHEIYLKFYADEAYRTRWRSSWPEDLMPEHEEPRFNRDAKLPKSPHD